MEQSTTNQDTIVIRSAEDIISDTHFYYNDLLIPRNNTIGTYGTTTKYDGINTYH